MSARVLVFDDADALAREASTRVAAALRDAAAQRGRASLVLSGGSTPRPTHRALGARDDVDWRRVVVLWADERCVPPDDPASNYGMARQTLLEGRAFGGIVRIRGELSADEAAAAYARELEEALGEPCPRFDVVLLGLGADGHTASLFPGDDMRHEGWVAAVRGPPPHRARVTLTHAALDAAREVIFLVAGAEKADALARVLAGEDALPATRVQPRVGPPLWLVDRAAAGRA